MNGDIEYIIQKQVNCINTISLLNTCKRFISVTIYIYIYISVTKLLYYNSGFT